MTFSTICLILCLPWQATGSRTSASLPCNKYGRQDSSQIYKLVQCKKDFPPLWMKYTCYWESGSVPDRHILYIGQRAGKIILPLSPSAVEKHIPSIHHLEYNYTLFFIASGRTCGWLCTHRTISQDSPTMVTTHTVNLLRSMDLSSSTALPQRPRHACPEGKFHVHT